MSLAAIGGTPLVVIGIPFVRSNEGLSALVGTTQDAANEACIMYGHYVTDDGGSHTIDTSGSSAIEWRSGAVTLANGASAFKVGLAAVDTANGPPGRAANAADVISFDVSRTYTSAAAPAANSAVSSIPTAGSKTIAHGDFGAVATQMTARAGADSIVTNASGLAVPVPRPGVTGFTGAAYASVNAVPNAIITFSDGHLAWFYGGAVGSGNSTQTWNSGSATKEYGNLFHLPFPVTVYGIIAACNVAGDTDFVLYSDALGTPVAERTVSADLNTVSSSSSRYAEYLFSTPYSVAANADIAAIVKPTSGTSISATFKSYSASAHQVAEVCGTSAYAVNRASGAFAAQNSSKDRFAIGLLVGAFDAGGGGMLVHPGMSGGMRG